jgi:Spy/CpxP family protein refolding chaperone
MRLSPKRWLGLAAAALLAAAVPAGAQTGSAAPATAEGPMTGAPKKNLSPQEQLNDAQNQLGRMEGASTAVRKQLEQARAQRDVVKTLCLNDKLNQIDVAIRSAKERRDALKSAVSRNDAELAGHEYTILSVLRQRAEQLAAEANQCIGEEAVLLGQSSVTTTIDPTIPPDQDETRFPPTDPSMIGNPPICVSCSR